MKALITAFSLFISLEALTCMQSAQFIASVSTIVKNQNGCDIYIQAKDLEQFNPSYTCPLVPGEVLDTKISITNNKDYYCGLEEGDMVSGVLIKLDDDSITIY